MSDVNEIKAGSYELVAELWDKPTSKPGEPFDFIRYRKGDTVELSAEEARRLFTTGAVVEPGAAQKAAAEQARLAYEAALALVPDSLRSELPAPGDLSGAEPLATGLTAPVGGPDVITGPGTVAAGTSLSDPGVSDPGASGYDPSAEGETVEKVLAHVSQDQAEAARVLELEKAGKNRSTLVEQLEAIANQG